jgi:hypothetical protein
MSTLTIEGYCPSGKMTYKTRAKARKGLRRKAAANHNSLTYYRCSDCGNWHLTSSR